MSFTVRRLRDEKPQRAKQVKKAGLMLLQFSGPLLMIGRMWGQHREKKRQQQERVNILKRITVILVAALFIVLLGIGTVKALMSLKILSFSSLVTVAGSDLPSDDFGHTNVLLLGQGDAGHEGIDLTDTIMIASLDPAKTKSAVLMSLPRDLYFLETENMGKGRINSLYRDYKVVLKREGKTEEEASKLAMRELANEIGRAMGMDIHHIVKVDFIGFVQAVDAIGGIDIVVPERLVDTEYPGPNYSYETFSIEAGPQHIDGETALKYARSRHSTSDFARSARQQQIIKAIGEKVKSEGILTRPAQIMDLLEILNEHVLSTLELRDMVSLAGMGKELDQSKLISMQLNTQNGLYGSFSEPGGLLYTPPRDQFGGAAVLLPVSIPENPVTWKQLRLLTQLLIHEREAYAEKAPIRILNAGAEAGSARRLGGELIRFGFNVVAMENAAEDMEYPNSRITGGEDSPTALTLNRFLDMEFIALPPPAASSSRSDAEMPPEVVTIELGEDYVYTPLQLAAPNSVPPQE
jgi:LCP family protein required for cell wall assembly